MTTRRTLIIATGPSLNDVDIEIVRYGFVRRGSVFAVNDAYRVCSFADVLYACDLEWWDHHEEHTRGIPRRWTTNNEAAAKYGLRHVPGQHADAARMYFDASGDGIIYGGNSGFQAVNLAFKLGARDVGLLGFDMGHEPHQPKHFFGDHPSEIDRPSPFAGWLKHWRNAVPEIMRAGMRVTNLTRGGALDCFPRADLEEWINQ